MYRFIRFFLLISFISFLVSSAFAQDFSRKFTMGIEGGFWKLGLTERSDSNTVGNQGTLFFKYDLKEKISFALSATYGKIWEADLSGKEIDGAKFSFSKKDAADQSTYMWLDASFIYSFRSWERLNPYFLGGMGIVFWKVKDQHGNSVRILDRKQNYFVLKDQVLTFSGGGGLEYRIKERWGINFGTRFHYLTHTLTSFKGSKDIVGSEPGELDLPRATLEVFLGINYYFGKKRDSDKDGITDRLDFCADTPLGAIADERGCPLDSDGDGIYDGLDRCPGTPPRVKVDVNGCPL